MKKIINTDKAPKAIGTYSQAVVAGDFIYLSGQIPLIPETMELEVGFTAQAHRVFKNIEAICEAGGAKLEDIVKLNISLTDLANFAELNQIMGQYFQEPYPARAAVQVAGLPKGSLIEIEAIVYRA